MLKNGQDAAAADAQTKRLAKLRAALDEAGATRGAKTRRVVENEQHKRVGKRHALRATGRQALFNFRAHPDMHKACMEAAKARQIKLAEWMQEHLAAALESEGRDTSFLEIKIEDL